MKKKYKDEQFLVTTLLEKSLKNNKIVQAYMFSSEDINYAMDFAIDFSKDLICKEKNDKERSLIENRIDKNLYPELKIIEPINDIIKKEQFLSIKEFLNNKPIEGNKIIYIIKNCEKMNKKTANSMLKFVEEASEDLIAIFLTNNIDLVIPTIVSRCQKLNLNNVSQITLNNLVNDEEQLENFIRSTILFVNNINNNGINTFFKAKQLIYDNYKDNQEIKVFLNLLLYFYYDVLNYKIMNKIKYYKDNKDDIIEISSSLNIDSIINKINVVEKINNNNNFNINQKLMIDDLILELNEV